MGHNSIGSSPSSTSQQSSHSEKTLVFSKGYREGAFQSKESQSYRRKHYP